jgi:methylenetetrahydrofolate reductase (NADPH)
VKPVHNDFHATRGIFPIFDGLQVKDIDKPLHNPSVTMPTTNGHHDIKESNGTNGTNGTLGTNGETREVHSDEKHDTGLLAAAKNAAADISNGIKGLALSH